MAWRHRDVGSALRDVRGSSLYAVSVDPEPTTLTDSRRYGHSAEARDARERRREQVAALLVARASLREIAEALGVSHGTIGNDVAIIRQRWREQMAQAYDAHVADQFGILDALLRAWMPRALGSLRVPLDAEAAAQIRWVVRERARLLGLDKPVKAQVQVSHEWETETDARIRELLDQMGPVALPASTNGEA